MDGFDKNEEQENRNQNQEKQEIFSQAVRAGNRTYFFDVKATRRNEYYLTITESKKRFNKEGRYFFEKHKIFLYREDFDKFSEVLQSTIDFIKTEKSQAVHDVEDNNVEETVAEDYTKVEFEDLNES